MVRSAAAVLALVLLPGALQAQQRHQVVDGETLWGLAQRYYSDAWRWPSIYEANRGVVEDPHWIYPGEELLIPDVAATPLVAEVTVEPVPAEPECAPAAVPEPVEPERTVFFRDEVAAGFGIGGDSVRRLAVPRAVSVSAPWLGSIMRTPSNIGVVTEFSGADDERVRRTTALPYDRLQVELPGLVAARGTQLLAFRVDRSVLGVGQVLVPTGVLTVSDPTPGGAVALVVDIFDHLEVGDFLQVLPSFPLEPGVVAQPIASGPEATIIGFAGDRALQSVHDVAFLDQGSDHGVAIGDEYVAVWDEGNGSPVEIEGRLQVISVHADHSSARVVWLRNPVFETGGRVELDRKMP